MRALGAFLKKEWIESVRSGKFFILLILFILFGIMNPAIAKLTPWMMEMLAGSLAETGLAVTEVEVDALTSWTQFFKNIPMGLITFVLIYGSIFTREYQSGTLVLMLTKGLPRRHVVLAKAALMLLLWTTMYFLCFAITYGYNAFFWDNSVAMGLWQAVFCWWMFGVWVISLTVIFAVVSENSAGVLLGTGGVVAACYLVGLLPKVWAYLPTALMDISALLTGGAETDTYVKAVVVALCLSTACIGLSIPVMNRRQL